MKNLAKVSFAVGVTVASMSTYAKAQTVEVNALGSSGLFLELGLGASSSTGTIKATCVWSENTNLVVATDTSTGTALTDKGNAFVAWTPGTNGTCSSPTSPNIYAYLQTDSVVGNRCLFDGSKCKIAYPTNSPAPAGLILSASAETALPASIATALNAAAVNAAGTDIRPEDAEFAIARTLAPCGTPVASGSQYLGLGYANGSTIDSYFSTKTFNVINFALPASYSVTPVGATPVLVVVNGNGDASGFSQSGITNLSNTTLAKFLDGTDSYADQALASNPSASGDKVEVLLREPLSGTYNTLEYNIPNTTGNTMGITPAAANKTSQDVGLNQPTAQKNCTGTAVKTNPLNIATPSGGARQRAIGTGEELSEVIAEPNSLGYGFWSVANYKGFTSTAAPYAKYLKVDGVDPLLKSGATYTGVIPVTGSAELANVDLSTTANGSYPIWSLLRLVNTGSTAPTAVTNLAAAAGAFVSFGTSSSRPDFIKPSSLKVVRSHFIPPAGLGEPTTAANGHVGLTSSACSAPEKGGDVGGVVYTLAADSSYCTTNKVTTGQTGQRR